jgi:predicted HD superfamily hydrolase involved in NAD metabolism
MHQSSIVLNSHYIGLSEHPTLGLASQTPLTWEVAYTDATKGKRDQVLSWLQEQVPQKRLQHILRVEQMAIDLACHHRLDIEKAAQAGLMHDLAKCFKPQTLLQMAVAEGLELNAVEVANPHLLHAAVGAIVAREQFNVSDPEVLDAIRHHTVGEPDMSLLSCVVFLADTLEPGRGDTLELNQLRQICREDLHQAVWLACDYSLTYLLSSQCLVHPQVVQTRNWALQVSPRTRHR